MKHFLTAFNEEISDESTLRLENGLVYIRSEGWTAAEIIDLTRKADGGNDVFDRLFREWLQARIENKVEEADDLLATYDQEDTFSLLIKAHKADGVMPFVGAGLSMSSGYPGWSAFLRKQLRKTLISEDLLEELIRKGLFEEAAQQIYDAQKLGFNVAVEGAFDIERTITGPVGLLPYVFPGCVATTNFDSVLERSYQAAEKRFSDIILGSQSDEIKRKLSKNSRFLLKLHGTAESNVGRVLTLDEYNAHYVGSCTLQKTISTLCGNKSLLFLGCSLTVDRTLRCIQKYVSEEGHNNLPIHFSFLASPSTQEERVSREIELAQFHIYPIWYPQGTHDESIEALLIKLLEATQP